MSGKLDVSRIKAAAGGRTSAMPDKQISLDIQLPQGKQVTLQVTDSRTHSMEQIHPVRDRADLCLCWMSPLLSSFISSLLLSPQFRRDLTVDYVKLQLAARCGLSAASLELELDGQAMADPLSLSDFPSLAATGSGVGASRG